MIQADSGVVSGVPLVSDEEEQLTVSQQDPRHQQRVALMQAVFAASFGGETTHEEARQVIEQFANLDQTIAAAAPERPLSEINKVDLAVLRVIVFESEWKKTPKKVLINEAVELAKEFGSESSPRFINGVLATIFELPTSDPD